MVKDESKTYDNSETVNNKQKLLTTGKNEQQQESTMLHVWAWLFECQIFFHAFAGETILKHLDQELILKHLDWELKKAPVQYQVSFGAIPTKKETLSDRLKAKKRLAKANINVNLEVTKKLMCVFTWLEGLFKQLDLSSFKKYFLVYL